MKIKKEYLLIFFLITLLISCANKTDIATQFYMKAVDEYQNQKFDDALKNIALSLDASRSFHQSLFLKGRILFMQGQFSEAEKIFEALIRNHQRFTEARLWYIRSLIFQNKFDQAQKELDRELAFNHSDWRFLYQYALLSERQENFEQWLGMLGKAEQHISEAGKVYLDTARFWFALDLLERSDTYLNKAEMILPQDGYLSGSVIELRKKVRGGKWSNDED